MRPVLLHYHILKNGGSTLEEILRRSLFDRFISFDHPDPDAEIKNPELIDFLKRHPQCAAFSSHQIFYPVPKERGFLFFDLCFLRDPLDRIRSIYDYFRGKPAGADPIRMLAHRHSLREFVRGLIDQMPWTVTDVQVNLLAHGLVNDCPRPADLEIALRRMRETSFLGVVGRFEESLVAAEYAMRAIFPAIDCARERVNESAPPHSSVEQRIERFRAALGEDLFTELSRRNQMDRELLEQAQQEVRRRFESTPGAEARLSQIKRGILRSPAPRRRATAPMPETPVKAGVFRRWRRGLRFLLDLQMSRPRSQFRRIFDPAYYGGSLWHYVTRGAFEGRDPHPFFDTEFFSSCAKIPPETNPLVYFLRNGGRPHPLFDPDHYLRRYPDVAKARINPLLHYILHGAAERRKPNPWFAPEFYIAGCPEARQAAHPLLHFLETESANPHPFFDCESYRRAHPDLRKNPLADFLSRPDPPAGAGSRLELEDVTIEIVLAASGAREIYQHTGAAVIWTDSRGAKNFRCEPHLERFLRCLRPDQL